MTKQSVMTSWSETSSTTMSYAFLSAAAATATRAVSNACSVAVNASSPRRAGPVRVTAPVSQAHWRARHTRSGLVLHQAARGRLAQARERPVLGNAHRAGGGAHDLGGLLGREPDDDAQQEDLALLPRQLAQQGPQLRRHPPPHRVLLGPALARHDVRHV